MLSSTNDGPSLSELIERFRLIQHEGTRRKRLNERNAIDIVGLIQRRGLLTDLIILTNGQGYMTREQLTTEVRNEIDAAGGRLNIVDLPNILHVEHSQVARAVDELLANTGGSCTQNISGQYRIINGEIMSLAYVSALVREALGWLKEAGGFKISDFAKKFSLPLDFITNVLKTAVHDGSLVAVINGDTLYTSTFVASQRKRIVCALLGCSGPTDLPALFTRHDILADIGRTLTLSILEKELKNFGRVDGAQFVPTHFELERNKRIKSALLLNHYVSFATLRAEGITNMKQYTASSFNPPSSTESSSACANDVATKKRAGNARKGQARSSESLKNSGGDFQITQMPDATTVFSSSCVASVDYPLAGHVLSECFLSDTFFNTGYVVEAFEEVAKGDMAALFVSDYFPSCVDWARDATVLTRCIYRHFPACETACSIIEEGASGDDGGGADCAYFVNVNAIDGFFASIKAWLIENRVTNRDVALREIRRQLISLLQNDVDDTALSFSVSKHKSLSKSQIKKRLKEGSSFNDSPVASNASVIRMSRESAESLASKLLDTRRDFVSSMLRETSRSQRQREEMNLRSLKQSIEEGCRERWVEMSFARKALAATGRLRDHCSEESLAAISSYYLKTIGAATVADLILDVGIDRGESRAWCEQYLLGREGVGVSDFVGGTFQTISIELLREGVELLPSEIKMDYQRLIDATDIDGEDAAKGPQGLANFLSALSNACTSGTISLSCFHQLGKKSERDAQSAWLDRVKDCLWPRVRAFAGDGGSRDDIIQSFRLVVSYALASRHRCLVIPPPELISSLLEFLRAEELRESYTSCLECDFNLDEDTRRKISVLCQGYIDSL